MLPMKAVRLQLGELLAADATTLAPPALNNKIALVKAAFAVSEDLNAAALTLADFDGSTELSAGLGTQQVGNDPATGEQIITIKEPVGGWRFETTGVTNLPQTIYGFALLDSTLATLIGAALLPAPIALTEIGQEINLGVVQMRFVTQPLA
jgi:hypothetical protein